MINDESEENNVSESSHRDDTLSDSGKVFRQNHAGAKLLILQVCGE